MSKCSFFAGDVSEVHLWHRCRSPEEIAKVVSKIAGDDDMSDCDCVVCGRRDARDRVVGALRGFVDAWREDGARLAEVDSTAGMAQLMGLWREAEAVLCELGREGGEGELLPCPFCGSDDVQYYPADGYVECLKCEGSGPVEDRDMGIGVRWDRRASQWASVEERLPENYTDVLCLDIGGARFVGFCCDGV